MKYPLMAMPFSSVLLLAACGGHSTGGDLSPPPVAPPPTPAPTVAVTAPATGVAGFPFTASWASTNATSCTSTFSRGTGPTGTINLTETSAGTKTYTVTCTGAGGTASGSATAVISPAPTAEGLWHGTTGDARTLNGIVTTPDNSSASQYWFVYTLPNSAAPAGFIAGTGISTASNASSGSFASSDLREFNFAANKAAASGSLTAPFVQKVSLGTTGSPLSGSYQSTVIITSSVFPQTYTVASAPEVPVIYNTQDGSGNPVSYNLGITGSSTGTASLSAGGVLTMTLQGESVLDISAILNQAAGTTYSDTITHSTIQLNTTGAYNLTKTNSSNTTTSCSNGPHDGVNSCSTLTLNTPAALFGSAGYYSAQSFTLSGGVVKVKTLNAGAQVTTDYTLTNSTAAAPVSTTFASNYLSAYETAPAVSAVAGSFTGSAGIGVNLQTAATFFVAADGSITGTESVSHCSYTGTLAAHATGNVYDVTALIFANAGGTCTYTAQGAFVGAATYDATSKTLSVTALDSTRSYGFLFVGAKP